MRKTLHKTLAVTAVTAAMITAGAGAASASDSGDTRVDSNQVQDNGNISVNDLLDGNINLSDVANDNEVLSGNDTDVSDNLNGDNLSGNDASQDNDTNENNQNNEDGLLSGLLG